MPRGASKAFLSHELELRNTIQLKHVGEVQRCGRVYTEEGRAGHSTWTIIVTGPAPILLALVAPLFGSNVLILTVASNLISVLVIHLPIHLITSVLQESTVLRTYVHKQQGMPAFVCVRA